MILMLNDIIIHRYAYNGVIENKKYVIVFKYDTSHGIIQLFIMIMCILMIVCMSAYIYIYIYIYYMYNIYIYIYMYNDAV